VSKFQEALPRLRIKDRLLKNLIEALYQEVLTVQAQIKRLEARQQQLEERVDEIYAMAAGVTTDTAQRMEELEQRVNDVQQRVSEIAKQQKENMQRAEEELAELRRKMDRVEEQVVFLLRHASYGEIYPRSHLPPRLTSTQQHILEILKSEQPLSAQEIAERLGKSREHVSRTLSKLCRMRLVARRQEGRHILYYIIEE